MGTRYLKVHPSHLVPTDRCFGLPRSYRKRMAAGELRGARRDASMGLEGWKAARQSCATEMRSLCYGDKSLVFGGQTRRTKPLRL